MFSYTNKSNKSTTQQNAISHIPTTRFLPSYFSIDSDMLLNCARYLSLMLMRLGSAQTQSMTNAICSRLAASSVNWWIFFSRSSYLVRRWTGIIMKSAILSRPTNGLFSAHTINLLNSSFSSVCFLKFSRELAFSRINSSQDTNKSLKCEKPSTRLNGSTSLLPDWRRPSIIGCKQACQKLTLQLKTSTILEKSLLISMSLNKKLLVRREYFVEYKLKTNN